MGGEAGDRAWCGMCLETGFPNLGAIRVETALRAPDMGGLPRGRKDPMRLVERLVLHLYVMQMGGAGVRQSARIPCQLRWVERVGGPGRLAVG